MSTVEFLVPDLGEGLAEVEVVRWLVPVNGPVVADQPMVVVQTDKADVDVPAPTSGTLVGVGGQEGDLLPVGAVLARIETTGAAFAVAPAAEPATPAGTTAATAPVAAQPRSDRRPLASPATRRRAVEAGIDLAAVTGSGPNGRITNDDLERHRAEPTSASRLSSALPSDDDVVIPLRGVRRRTAEAMADAWRRIPHIVEFRTVEVGELLRARAVLQARVEPTGRRVSLFALLVRAVAVTLRHHPNLNATFDDDGALITQHGARNIGIAAATDDGLLVPVVKHADRLPVLDLGDEIRRLATGARAGTLQRPEMQSGTFTISNFGSNGTMSGIPIIRPPEVAILGVGQVADTVVAVDGRPEVRPAVTLTLSLDHRVNDGAHGAAFLDDLATVLSDPILLVLEG
jgi:pyruvate/2-oxoglutarate dehydrogenase complex dihydrolipoamide acyltransferase (E2) component